MTEGHVPSEQLAEAMRLLAEADKWSKELDEQFYALRDTAPKEEEYMFGDLSEQLEQMEFDHMMGYDLMLDE